MSGATTSGGFEPSLRVPGLFVAGLPFPLHILTMLYRIWWCCEEMVTQSVRRIEPGEDVWPNWSGYFCTGSGCIEGRVDSHGECINCGEPVIRVTDFATPVTQP